MVAGGGLGCSRDHGAQGALTHARLEREVHLAMRLLRPGGHLVVKLYDCFGNDTTKPLLRWLAGAFEALCLTKPLSSRPANSERYAVCLRLRRVPQPVVAGGAFDAGLSIFNVNIAQRQMRALRNLRRALVDPGASVKRACRQVVSTASSDSGGDSAR